MEDFIQNLNPSTVDFSNGGAVIVYVIRIILVLVALGGIGFIIFNVRKFINFVRNTISELKKVEWLSRSNLYKYTLIVFGMIFVSTLFILFADKALLFARNLLILSSN